MTEIQEISVAESVAELLNPISDQSPAGADATNVEEYFKLNMEIGKNAKESVRNKFLITRLLSDYLYMLNHVICGKPCD